MNKISTFLIEEQEEIRAGIKKNLAETQIEFAGEACNITDAFDKLHLNKPQVILLCNSISDFRGLETINILKQSFSDSKVLVMSDQTDDKHFLELITAGADGFIKQNSEADELIFGIKRLAEGGCYIGSEYAVSMINKLQYRKTELKKNSILLSKREMEVLKFIAEGYTNNEIAEKIFLSRRTVETHRKNLIEKTGSKNTAALIKFALENEIIQ